MPKKFDNNPRQKPVIVPTSFPLDNDIFEDKKVDLGNVRHYYELSRGKND